MIMITLSHIRQFISRFIDEETITYGYGELDSMGLWEYQLPFWFTKNFDKNGH